MSNPIRPPPGTGSRHETQEERDDRNLAELLQELRVAGLGVQVLFGFLLGLPFTVRFSRLSHAQRDLYVTDIVLAAIATATLVGPVAYHRLVFRQHQKEHLVKIANVMALCGLAIVALAVSGAVLLVVSYVLPGLPTVVISVSVFLAFVGLWLAVPLARRAHNPPDDMARPSAGQG